MRVRNCLWSILINHCEDIVYGYQEIFKIQALYPGTITLQADTTNDCI